jgi:hypothetical protein
MDAYVPASKRHHQDAEILFTKEQYDNAYYHALFAIECALKALLNRRFRGHDIPVLTSEVRKLDPQFSTFPPIIVHGDFPNCRYQGDGYAEEAQVWEALAYWEEHLAKRLGAITINGAAS